MIKDNKLTCDNCDFLFVKITTNGHRQLHVQPPGLSLDVKPEQKDIVFAICPKCKSKTPIQRDFFGQYK